MEGVKEGKVKRKRTKKGRKGEGKQASQLKFLTTPLNAKLLVWIGG